MAKKQKDNSMALMIAKMHEEENKRKTKAKEELKRIGADLFLEGVATVVASYDGHGDSGDMESVLYYGAGGSTLIDRPSSAIKTHEDNLKSALWYFVPAGFENNEGGYGEVTFKIADNKVTCAHNQRIEEIESSENSYDL